MERAGLPRTLGRAAEPGESQGRDLGRAVGAGACAGLPGEGRWGPCSHAGTLRAKDSPGFGAAGVALGCTAGCCARGELGRTSEISLWKYPSGWKVAAAPGLVLTGAVPAELKKG